MIAQANGNLTQTDEWKAVSSPVTGRRLLINLSKDRFLISPDFSGERLSLAMDMFAKHYRTQPPATPPLRTYLFSFNHTSDLDDFRTKFELLVSEGKRLVGNQNSGRIFDLLTTFWWHRLIALPADTATLYLGRIHTVRTFYGDIENQNIKRIIDDVASAGDFVEATTSQQIRKIITLMTSICGAREIGDLVPEAVNGKLTKEKLGKSTAQVILRIMAKDHPLRGNDFHFHDYGPFGRQDIKGDADFNWVTRQRHDLEEWRAAAKAWVAQLHRGKSKAMSALTSLFEAMMDSTCNSLSIEQILRDHSLLPLGDVNELYYRDLSHFFDWLIENQFTREDQSGRPEVPEGIANPVNPPPARKQDFETVYDIMPTRFIRRLRDIIEANDFQYPREAFGKRTDYLRRFNDKINAWEYIWCPIRAYLILIKLEIPQRTYQVRVCNSGEADPQRYFPSTESWEKNKHPLAGKSTHKRPMGVITKIYDRHQNKYSTGLFFNTNKTADVFKRTDDRGHIVPWKNDRVLQLLNLARQWQETYNPVSELTRWKDFKERGITLKLSDSILEEMGSETFLFRDPFGLSPDQPIAHTRLVTFWNEMCAELERVLEDEGERDPQGKPFVLVSRDANGRPSGATFPLHALRPTIITSWAEKGVSIDVLMKVAGHAHAIMAIFYQKRSIGHYSEILNDATIKVFESEQENWERFTRDLQLEKLETYVSYNDNIGLSAYSAGTSTSKVRMPYGVCPVGCKRCSEGGQPIDKNRQVNGPVAGEPQNCIRCRYFITGVPYIFRLIEHFHFTEFRLKEASRLYSEAEMNFEKTNYQRKQSVAQGLPFPDLHRLEVLSATLDQRTREVDELTMNFHAFYNKIEDCLRIRDAHQADGTFALVVSESLSQLEFVLEVDEDGSREVEWLDQICQQATFYASPDLTLPNLKRMRRYDAFIKKQGFAPVFWEMSEEDALRIGNEFGRFMFTTYGPQKANDLFNGRLTLKALGIEEENRVVKKLNLIVGRPLNRPTINLIEN